MVFKFKNILVSILICLIGIAGLFGTAIPSYASGIFTATGSLNYGRSGHSATLLPSGKVLIVGGNGSIPTAELYDTGVGTFSQTGNLLASRQYGNTATLLPNGKVLIAGGIVAYHTSGEAELYDPATGIFTPTGSMAYGRNGHTATLLSNGKILIVGGSTDGIGSTRHTEIYDPATGSFTLTGDITYARYGHTATLLSNGKVLVIGGNRPTVFDPDPGTNLEIYDPNHGTFSLAGNSVYPRIDHTATVLLNGKLLTAGGYNNYVFPLDSAELYDPVAGIAVTTGDMLQGRWTNTATLLSNGNVLITGGYSDGGVHKLSSAELYDPVIGTFSSTGNMTYARNNHTATILPNGKVLVVGGGTLGAGDTLIAELYSDNVSPVVDAITAPADSVSVNTSISVGATFTDSDTGGTHTAVWNWGDNTASAGSVIENNGSGSVSGTHTYTAAGVYTVSVTVTDNHGASGTASYSSVVIYDPSAGFVTGSGSFNSQLGAYIQNPTVTGQLKFNIQAKYNGNNTVPAGKINLDFKGGNFSFDSTSLQWLVINGNKAVLKGIGTINGSGSYAIFISVIDEDKKVGTDRIRIKIIDSSNNLFYDNQAGDPENADPITPITKGSLKIH
ncbi:MAG: hypothetical protein HYW62_03470 [Candidatus Levybacteria bacterium]|nr:hypothetical protein [Candidatus Levybacteria bacterium]